MPVDPNEYINKIQQRVKANPELAGLASKTGQLRDYYIQEREIKKQQQEVLNTFREPWLQGRFDQKTSDSMALVYKTRFDNIDKIGSGLEKLSSIDSFINDVNKSREELKNNLLKSFSKEKEESYKKTSFMDVFKDDAIEASTSIKQQNIINYMDAKITKVKNLLASQRNLALGQAFIEEFGVQLYEKDTTANKIKNVVALIGELNDKNTKDLKPLELSALRFYAKHAPQGVEQFRKEFGNFTDYGIINNSFSENPWERISKQKDGDIDVGLQQLKSEAVGNVLSGVTSYLYNLKYKLQDQREKLQEQQKVKTLNPTEEEKIVQEGIANAEKYLKNKENYFSTNFAPSKVQRVVYPAVKAFLKTTKSTFSLDMFKQDGVSQTVDISEIALEKAYNTVRIDMNSDGKIDGMDVDSSGNPIYSTTFSYVKKDGSMGYNFGAVPEVSAKLIGHMLPSVILGAATNLIPGMNALNLWRNLNIANRIATLGTVTAGTYQGMLEEEGLYTKDSSLRSQRALGRALIEGLTEAIGMPDFGAVSASRFLKTSLKDDIYRALIPKGATVSKNLKHYLMHGAVPVIKKIGAQNISESLEEEMSLFGNYFLTEGIKKYQDNEYARNDEITSDAIFKTFIDSFVTMVPYSGLTTLASSRLAKMQNDFTFTANWNVANNPEIYKSKIKDLLNKKKIDEKTAQQALSKIDTLKNKLDSMVALPNIKDLRTLLDDKDKQMEYFATMLKRDNLQEIVYEELTDEQKKALKNISLEKGLNKNLNKVLKNLNKKKELDAKEKIIQAQLTELKNKKFLNVYDLNADQFKTLKELNIIEEDITPNETDLQKALEDVNVDLYKIEKRAAKYANLTKADKEDIISNLFKDEIKRVESLEDIEELVSIGNTYEKQLTYLQKNNTGLGVEIEGRNALISAIDTKIGELTTTDEEGLNKLDRSLKQSKEISTSLQEKINTYIKASKSKNYIAEETFQEVEQDFLNFLDFWTTEFNNASEEAQVIKLSEFLKNNEGEYLFNLESLINSLTYNKNEKEISPNISQEVFEKARELALEKKVSEKQNVTEDKDVETENQKGETVGKKEVTTKETTDETKTEPLKINELEVIDSYINNSLSRLEATVALLEAIKTNNPKIFSLEAFLRKLNSVINSYRLEPENKDLFARISLDNWKKYLGFFYNIQDKTNADLKKLIDSFEEDFTEEYTEEQKENTRNLFKLAYNVASKAKLIYEVENKKSLDEEDLKEAQEEAAKASFDESDSFGEQSQESSKEQTKEDLERLEKEKELELKGRVLRVSKLFNPFVTNGIEVGNDNKPYTDEAIIRDNEIIKSIKEQIPANSKVLISSSINVLRKLLGENFNRFEELVNKGNSITEEELNELINFTKNNFFNKSFINYILENGLKVLNTPFYLITDLEGNPYLFQTSQGEYPLFQSLSKKGFKESNLNSEDKELFEENRQEILKNYAEKTAGLTNLISQIEQEPNTEFYTKIENVSNGVYINTNVVKVGETSLSYKSKDVVIAKNSDQKIGKYLIPNAFGKAYLVIDGEASELLNTFVNENTQNEIEAIAALLYEEDQRIALFGKNNKAISESLKKDILNIFNIYTSKSRKLFFIIKPDGSFVIKTKEGVLNTKEDFIKWVIDNKIRYNITDDLQNEGVPRYSINSENVIEKKVQNFIDYINETHKVHMRDGELNKRVNLQLIFDTTELPKSVIPKNKKEEVKETVVTAATISPKNVTESYEDLKTRLLKELSEEKPLFDFTPEERDFIQKENLLNLQTQSKEVEKTDLPLGKIGNTEYEVKSDGVYYQNKKLNNPKSLSHKELIEDDIERRKKEELKNVKPTSTPNEVSNFPLLKGTDVVRYIPEDIAQKAWEYWDKVYNTKQSLERAKQRGGFGVSEMDEFYPNWRNELPEAKAINAKYNAELAALEGTKEVTETKATSDTESKKITPVKLMAQLTLKNKELLLSSSFAQVKKGHANILKGLLEDLVLNLPNTGKLKNGFILSKTGENWPIKIGLFEDKNEQLPLTGSTITELEIFALEEAIDELKANLKSNPNDNSLQKSLEDKQKKLNDFQQELENISIVNFLNSLLSDELTLESLRLVAFNEKDNKYVAIPENISEDFKNKALNLIKSYINFVENKPMLETGVSQKVTEQVSEISNVTVQEKEKGNEIENICKTGISLNKVTISNKNKSKNRK